ncbi:twin-arginine translocase subunit TatC [Deinococcus sp. LM3]|uniref:twin-arginine translocase subunit TatC n=1 Tax=unclassified Deinococcus TaxID=2623546 RepID=UPI000991C9C2|nr:twin-arginine translocase subunit TatC [Deinococcus sp. LM3]MCD0166482.1 twin-arginine translocase subunit TatC [Deinococcus sp. 12RED42]OOV13861.1 twin arginine-targeting protein translocase TatC [Deinococcus sp. LM3]
MSADPNANLKSAPLFDHLDELRKRIVISVIFLAVGLVVAFQYRVQLINLTKVPLNASEQYRGGDVEVVTQGLTDQFVLSLNISFWAGFALALPFILSQVWAFIAPGLYDHERRWALPFIIGAGFSFMGGAVFGYYLVLPTMVGFLLDFLAGTVTPLLNLRDYIGTVTTFLIAFGLSFELPILSVILTRIGIVNHTMLRKGWRIALIVIMIFAAVITPTPDPTSMLMVAVPLYVLYELGVILSRAFRLPPIEESTDETPALGL